MKKFFHQLRSFLSEIFISKRDLWDYVLILIGALVQALALRLFLIPSDLVGGGVSGLAQLIHHYTKFPIGLMVLIGNIPLFILGWQYLGGAKFAFRTIVKIVAFSIFTDTLV